MTANDRRGLIARLMPEKVSEIAPPVAPPPLSHYEKEPLTAESPFRSKSCFASVLLESCWAASARFVMPLLNLSAGQ